MALTNPITSQNIVDTFASYVVATANSGIVWGTNAPPTYSDGTVILSGSLFGGTTAGRAIGISGGNIGASGTKITAANIYNTLVAETAAYSVIRNLRAQLNVTGAGGNSGTRPTAGIVYDQTNVAYFPNGYRQTFGSPPATGGVDSGASITAASLVNLFTNLQNGYATFRANTILSTTNVCHASCHLSCHSSRGRR